MMNMITHLIAIMFNPILENTNATYQSLARQTTPAVDVFRAPNDGDRNK